MAEAYYQKRDREAAERLAALLALPMPKTPDDIGVEDFFDPWSLFPHLYGSYSQEFDEIAIEVLTEIMEGEKRRADLAAEMMREMLCVQDYCDYGSSPRYCFATAAFAAALPELLKRWAEFSEMLWSRP